MATTCHLHNSKLDAARYEILGFSTLTGKWDRSSDLILINGIPASLGSIFATSWLPSVAMLIRWMEQASNLRLCVMDSLRVGGVGWMERYGRMDI